MDFNTTIDIIIKDLREAREIINDFKNYPGVPQIQVELAKSKCKSAEEIIALLKTMKQDYQPVQNEGIEGTGGVGEVGEAKEAEVVEVAEKRKTKRGKLPESNIVADKFSARPNTFNEQLGNIKSDEDISSVIKSRPVGNLTDAIGINDKFFYIREIFNGDQLSYNEAITKLNKVDNLLDAKAVIMSYTGEGDENEAVKQLLDLVKRKLPADE
jgi:hypothetical protein